LKAAGCNITATAPGSDSVLVDGGTLTGGTGRINTPYLTINSGGFVAPSNSVSVTEYYTHAGGTVDWIVNSSTFVYATYGDMELPPDTYYHLLLQDSGGMNGTYILQPGATRVKGNLVLDGYMGVLLNVGGNTLIVDGDVTISTMYCA
jgi:hypothetical protein